MNLFGNSELLARRKRQLAVLLEAVEQAQQGARALCISRGDSHFGAGNQAGKDRAGDSDLQLLFGRLEAVRLEVEQLRRASGMGPFKEIDPKWTGLAPWRPEPDC